MSIRDGDSKATLDAMERVKRFLDANYPHIIDGEVCDDPFCNDTEASEIVDVVLDSYGLVRRGIQDIAVYERARED